jgi:hypothetical protein
MRWNVNSFDWKDVGGIYLWAKSQLDRGWKVLQMYTGSDQYAFTATDDVPAYLALSRMPGVDSVTDPMEIPRIYFQFMGDGSNTIPEWFFEEINGTRMAAEVGTDTASFYVIAPEQMWHIIEDQDWAGMAKKLWGGGPSGDVSKLIDGMAKLIRQHGGAHLTTGHDGPSDIGFKKKDTGQKEEGLLPPYGTSDFRKGKKASIDRIAARWFARQAGFTEDEILTRDVKLSLDGFIGGIIRNGQSIHKIFQQVMDSVLAGVEGGDKVKTDDVVKAVEKYLHRKWGKDAMTPLLARLIVKGDFIH